MFLFVLVIPVFVTYCCEAHFIASVHSYSYTYLGLKCSGSQARWNSNTPWMPVRFVTQPYFIVWEGCHSHRHRKWQRYILEGKTEQNKSTTSLSCPWKYIYIFIWHPKSPPPHNYQTHIEVSINWTNLIYSKALGSTLGTLYDKGIGQNELINYLG